MGHEICPEFDLKEEQLNKLVDDVRLKCIASQTISALKPKLDNDFLIKFLRCKKYQPDEAVKAIKKYYDNVYACIELVQDKHSRDFEPIYYKSMLRLLKNKVGGASVICYDVGSWDPSEFTLKELLGSGAFVFEELFTDKSTQVNGIICIMDISGFAFCHVRSFTYSNIKLYVKCIFDMFPFRFAGIHLINVPYIFWPVYKLGLRFLPSKLQGRVHLHRTIASVTQVLDPLLLPKSLGGVLTEELAWNTELRTKILNENKCYDSYWKR